MNNNELLLHWNYFCSLAAELEGTKDYVFHGLISDDSNELNLVHANVYSDKFKQIIILAASEFEVMSKSLCMLCGEAANNIVDISRILLHRFPRIRQFEIMTAFYIGMPLKEWEIATGDKVVGLDWWKAYNSLKHNETEAYEKATLKNAVLALACLYIVNLYMMHELNGNLLLAYDYPPVYFRSKYTAHTINSGDGTLPDYGNQSPTEVIRERFPELFDK